MQDLNAWQRLITKMPASWPILLVCATEIVSQADIDAFETALKEVLS